MPDLEGWLLAEKLSKYLQTFVDAEIELGDLSELTEADLKELGLPVGPRRRFFRAVREQFSGSDHFDVSPEDSQKVPGVRNEAERRQLTVMFADLVGSTSLSERLDPEDLRLVNRSFQDTAKAAIEAFDGFVARYMGDGVLAYFGYPIAHEDDAERSVRAGLRLVDELSKHPVTSKLSVRVGIATGPVVVGDLIGEGASQESAVVGETPNRAARLQNLAEPNTVIVGETTRTLVGEGFEFRRLSPTTLKGFSGQDDLYQVLFERIGQTRFSTRTQRGLSPFVGREEEMSLLGLRWERAKDGRGAATLLIGEPGIGKSRLVEEIRQRAVNDDREVLFFQCSAYHRNTPFYPLLTALEETLPNAGPDTSGRLEFLRRIYGTDNPETDLYPYLLSNLLSFDLPDHEPETLQSLEPDARRRQTIAALVEFVAFQSQRHGMLCIFEDLHWADPSSLEFLSHLVERLIDLPILLVGTTRPGLLATWSDLAHCRVIFLSRLEDTDALSLASSISELSAETIAKIADRAGGNPLFLEELVYSLADAQTRDSPDEEIPTTLQDSLMARLEATGIGRSVAQCAAVLGREFSEVELRAVWDGESTALSSGVAAIVKAGLLYERNSLDGRHEYIFKHALVRDAAYGTLLHERRRALHQRAANFLIDLRAKTTRFASYELVAEHLIEAGDTAGALQYWILAGETSAAASSYRECEAHLARVLEVIDQSDPGQFITQELDALVLLGPALMAQYGYSAGAVSKVYARARQISEMHPDKPYLTAILNGLRLHNICTYGVLSGLEPANALLQYADEIDDDASRIEGGKAVGSTLLWNAQLDASRSALGNAISLYEKGENMDVMRVDSDSGMTCHSFLAITEWASGNLDLSKVHSERAVALGTAPNRAFGMGEALSFRAFLLTLHRENTAAINVATQAFDLADEHNFILWKSMASLARGGALVDQGRVNDGLRHLNTSRHLMEQMGYVLWRPICLSQLARAHAMLGELEEALTLAQMARSFATTNDEIFWLPEVLRITGGIHRAAGEESDAREALDEALQIARDTSNRILELRASNDVAMQLIARNCVSKAKDLLEPVYEAFSIFPDNADVQDAGRTLAATLPMFGED